MFSRAARVRSSPRATCCRRSRSSTRATGGASGSRCPGTTPGSASPVTEARAILVTGAGGFVGGRIVEVLHAMGREQVRAGVRRWSSAARIGRFPVDIAQCDVTDPRSAARALEGVSAVVHCAVGDRGVTVEGTRNLLAAAERARVERVVFLSTVAVYGEGAGEFDERCDVRPTGNAYGDTKIEAERICLEFAARGLPVAILRPSLIYGPFSASWTIEWARRLVARPWLLSEEDCQGTCNLLYVDDLVGAVLAALSRPESAGEVFNVNGPDRPTWSQYFRALNAAMELPELVTARPMTSHLSARLMQPVRSAAKFAMRSEERRVGNECRSRGAREQRKQKREDTNVRRG